jgi:uncharacterized protein (TIGR02145 family)
MRKRKHFLILFLFILAFGCKEESDVDDYSLVTDIDGNVYKTVVIGDQIWMAENLRVTKYNNGIMINYYDLPGSGAGEYRWYEDNEANSIPNGAYYNFYAVSSGKLAPKGWRVATQEDYEILKTTLNGNLVAGGKMKIREPGAWDEPNELNGEDSGFNAFPAGSMYNGKDFTQNGTAAVWWTSTK